MLKKVILILVILTTLKFYELSFIPEVVIKVSEWLSLAIMAAVIVLHIAYSRTGLMKAHFTTPIILMTGSVVISMFAAYAFQNQPFQVTAYAQQAIYFYMIYLLLHLLRPTGDFLIKCILGFGLVYVGLYLLQYFVYPTQITNAKMFLDRGTLRIFLTGGGFLVIAYYAWLYLVFRKFRMRYVIFILLSMAIFVLLGTRQLLATVVLLTILFVLQSKIIKSKILLFLMFGLAVIPVFFIFQDILYAMFELTLEQNQAFESNIRLEAARYFLTDFFPNGLAYLTGNGASGTSAYGMRVLKIAKEYGYHQSDLGLLGEYTRYGVLFVVGVFIILYRVISMKIPEKLSFIKYNFIGIALTIVTGAGAFGSSGTNIIINSMMLYMIDLHLNDPNAFKMYPAYASPE